MIHVRIVVISYWPITAESGLEYAGASPAGGEECGALANTKVTCVTSWGHGVTWSFSGGVAGGQDQYVGITVACLAVRKACMVG